MKRLLAYLLFAGATLPNNVQGEGFTLAGVDATTRTVTLALDEATDIRNVHIEEVTYSVTPHNTNIDRQIFLDNIRPSREVTGTFDLRTPLYVTLTLYEDYDWQIVASQTIPLSFQVEGQIGAPEFDLDNRIARAYVAKDADRSRVTISELKLGPASTETVTTTYSPTMEELSAMDYSSPDAEDPTLGTPHFVDVTCHGRTERWVLYILPTAVMPGRASSGSAVRALPGRRWASATGSAPRANGRRSPMWRSTAEPSRPPSPPNP